MNVTDLSGYYFIDTNILIYQFDTTNPNKQAIAQNIVSHALKSRRGVISTQVVQEFLNVALRKFPQPLNHVEANRVLQKMLLPLCQHFPTIGFYEDALQIQSRTKYSWYDSLVITSAVSLNCQTLLSEDLHNNHQIDSLTILNPFS